MFDQRAHIVYRRQLLCSGHGYPFWVPEPDQSLPLEYRNRGIRIGDVGLITEDGGFDFLYNIHYSADHPINSGHVPPNFYPVPLLHGDRPIRETPHMHEAKSAITSAQVSKRALAIEASAELPSLAGGGFGFEFSAIKAEAAILMLPEGATRYAAKSRAIYSKYAMENGISLYQYVNGTLGREASNGSLYIITGCDKCRSWATAAVARPEDKQEVSLKIVAGGLAQGTVAIHTSSSLDFGVETRSYPPSQGFPTSAEENQCIFARGIVITARENRLTSKLLGSVQLSYISGSPKDRDWRPSPPGGRAPFSSSSSSAFPPSSSSSSSYGHSRSTFLEPPGDYSADDSEPRLGDSLELVACVENFPSYPTAVLNPAVHIAEHILSMHPSVDVVIIEDETWMDALRADNEKSVDFAQLLRKVLENNSVEDTEGIVVLRQLDAQEHVDHSQMETLTLTPVLQSEGGLTSYRQKLVDNQYSPTTSLFDKTITSGSGQYSNQVSRSRFADHLYVPEPEQPTLQNHVRNPLSTTSHHIHMSDSSFGFSTSAGSLLPKDTRDLGDTHVESMVATHISGAPIPFQTSFSQSAPGPSTPQSYYPTLYQHEDEELALDSKEVVKVKSRACQRCKNLKVKCEFKTDTDSCKRCMNGGHECLIPGKKKRHTLPKREHLLNEIREQAERIRELTGQLEDANKKRRQSGVMSDISSQGYAPSLFSALSPSPTLYESLDGINTNLDSETNKNITAWISKAKESLAEFDGFLSGEAGAPRSYFVHPEDFPIEEDVDDEFTAVASDGEDVSGDLMQKSQESSIVRRSSRSSVGSNLTRGGAEDRKQEAAKTSSTVPNEAVPLGLMANLSIRKTRQSGASAEVEDVGVANDGFFSPGPGPTGAHEMPGILARGLISVSEAEKLFSIYFDRMNLSLSLCDPVLYTPQKTCFRSPFMFTVICAIASRYYTARPALYDQIIVDAQTAAGAALISGVKNVEMCIGFILLSLYPVPTTSWENNRGWLYLGMAIRTAMDINLHLPNAAKPLTEFHQREILNRTRVWLNCFNLDRSTGSQYGKLPIINNMDYTANHSEDWWHVSPYNMKNFDIHISCYNAELRVMARFISRIHSDPKHPTGLNKDIDFAGIATETDEELKSLEAKWMAILDQTDMTDPQNRFRTGLLKLAFSYDRLVSLSIGFQHAFGKNRDNENPFLQRCLAAAYDVHDVILNDVGRPEQRIYLRHGPESQIFFVTFASTFLIKLLQPKYATYIDASQRSYIQQLVQGVIDLFGSPEVAVDERHGPKAYSRFLQGLLNSSPDVSMSYGLAPPSMSASLDASYEDHFLSPDPEYFRPPLPFTTIS